ncbi:hypothetical protein [Streptomyces smyrnaeus]|uniref:hypothetical protein n=1 Tax=Streptomyces smyrnaeus TaxID=1387713 RepID=UPI0033FD1657
MKIRTYAVVAALSLLPLAGCGDDDGQADAKADASKNTSGKQKKADCDNPDDLSQAEWMELCGDDAGMQDPTKPLQAGESFTFPDKLAVTVVKAEKMPASNADKDETPFRLHVKFANKSKQPVALDDFSLFVEGATNGGEAAVTTFDDEAAEEITGKLAPGVTTTKTEDWVIDKKYGTKLAVSLQYGDDGDYPEVNVTIH